MILGIEIAMLIVGILALVRGKLTITKTKVVEGTPARLLGILALTPLPAAFLAIMAYIASQGPADPEKFAEEKKWTLVGIEAAVVIGIAVLVFVIGAAIATDPKKARRREDDYDDDDRDREEYEDDREDRRGHRDDHDDDHDDDRDRRGRRRSWE